MILFLTQVEDDSLNKFSQEFSSKYGIKTVYKPIGSVVKGTDIRIFVENNDFSAFIDDINFNDVKICYLNSACVLSSELFDFESSQDNLYALQEWGATLTCLLNLNTSEIKYINPYIKNYSTDNQIENNMLFQRFGIETAETFLTNDAKRFLQFYKLYNKNLLIKNICSKANKVKLFSFEDLKNLKKLYLSPYVFQKNEVGVPVSILVVGENILAINPLTKEMFSLPLGVEENLVNLTHELNSKIVEFQALYNGENLYFYDINQETYFCQSLYTYGDVFVNAFSEFLLKEYRS